MISRKLDRQQVGRPIAARTINGLLERVNELGQLRAGPGLSQTQVGGASVLSAVLPGLFKLVESPAGGITAKASGTVYSGTCSEYTFAESTTTAGQGTLSVDTTRTVTAWNPFATAVPGATLCLAIKWLSRWWVIGWDCT